LANSFIILDEAQNFSRTELLNIISRVGEGSKVVFLADPAQVDNKFLQAGERSDIWAVVNKLKDESVFAHITLTKTERSKLAELASRILESEN
jgi:PhoH-like ATPase